MTARHGEPDTVVVNARDMIFREGGMKLILPAVENVGGYAAGFGDRNASGRAGGVRPPRRGRFF